MLQGDQDLVSALVEGSVLGRFALDPQAVVLAMEYRSVANRYLSNMPLRATEDIELSLLPEVNQMLIADKVQNRKDFLIYHADSHPRADALSQYFVNWLQRNGAGLHVGGRQPRVGQHRQHRRHRLGRLAQRRGGRGVAGADPQVQPRHVGRHGDAAFAHHRDPDPREVTPLACQTRR